MSEAKKIGSKITYTKPQNPDDFFPKDISVQEDFRRMVHEHWPEIKPDYEDLEELDFSRESVSDVLLEIAVLKPYLERLLSSKCDDTGEGKIVQSSKQYRGYDYITVPAGHELYKGMNSYVTIEEEERFFGKQTEPIPGWLGHKALAIKFAASQNGGVHSYRSKQELKYLVWNNNNIERMYAILCDIEKRRKGVYTVLKKAFQISIGIDIDPYRRLKAIYWYFDFIPLSPIVQSGTYYCGLTDTGISYYYKKFYMHKVLFRYWILPFVEQLGLHGVWGPQHYCPMIVGGQWIQEFIIGDYARYFMRTPSNPVDWQSYKDKLDFKMPTDGFITSPGMGSKNHNHRLMKWYLKMQDKSKTTKPYQRPKNSTVVVSLNVHNFVPIKINGSSEEQSVVEMLKLAKHTDADVVVLCEVGLRHIKFLKKHMYQYGYWNHSRLPENTTTMVLSRVKVEFGQPFRISEGNTNPEIRYARWATMCTIGGLRMAATHLSIGIDPYIRVNYARLDEITQVNSDYRCAEIDAIVQHQPDIIIGDFNFNPSDREYKHVCSLGYTTNLSKVESTTPFDTVVDYAFLKPSIKYTLHTVPYCYSDHLPIVLTLLDFKI
jgi:endonuclease/exonuclease/phosphatase family metal-dependent hydrolase